MISQSDNPIDKARKEYFKKYRTTIKRQEIEKFLENASKEQLIEKLMLIRCRLKD